MNAVLDIAWDHKDKINLMKLQKFIYIAHGVSLAITDEPLIIEKAYAWEFGPVIPKIYHEFKRYGMNPLNDYATILYANDLCIVTPPQNKLTLALLNGVWSIYGKWNHYQLANLTHEKDSPWATTYNNGEGEGRMIEEDLLKQYYKKVLKNAIRKAKR